MGTLSELPNLMRDAGHDPWELLESFGVTRAMMAKPMTPVPIRLHGQIMQAAALLTTRPNATDAQIEAQMDGILCRCGTYARVRKAIHAAASPVASVTPVKKG